MLQEYYLDVAKVDRDVAYIAIVVHVCCNCLSPKFYLFFVQALLQVFQTHASSVSFDFFLHITCVVSECFKSGL